MDPPAFQDRHPLLHPQQRLAVVEPGKDETGPAGIAGACRNKFGEGRSSLFGAAGWEGG
jgi:hypothetical protein